MGVWLSDVGDRKDNFLGTRDSVAGVGSRHVGYDSEERRQRLCELKKYPARGGDMKYLPSTQI
jgi:hypothetical protein